MSKDVKTLSPQDRVILHLYRQLTPREQQAVRDYYIKGDARSLSMLLQQVGK